MLFRVEWGQVLLQKKKSFFSSNFNRRTTEEVRNEERCVTLEITSYTFEGRDRQTSARMVGCSALVRQGWVGAPA